MKQYQNFKNVFEVNSKNPDMSRHVEFAGKEIVQSAKLDFFAALYDENGYCVKATKLDEHFDDNGYLYGGYTPDCRFVKFEE